MAAAVAAADPTGCTTVGVVDDVVDDADDVVVVVVPALAAGGSEITWLPTVWVYLIGVDLVTVTLGTGMDLDTGGCWKKESKFKDLSLSDSEECHNDTYKSTDRGRSIQGGYNTRRGSKRHLLKKK